MFHLQAQVIANDSHAINVIGYLITSLLAIVVFLLGFISKNWLKTVKDMTTSLNLMQRTMDVSEQRLEIAENELKMQREKLDHVHSTVERHSERFAGLQRRS